MKLHVPELIIYVMKMMDDNRIENKFGPFELILSKFQFEMSEIFYLTK